MTYLIYHCLQKFCMLFLPCPIFQEGPSIRWVNSRQSWKWDMNRCEPFWIYTKVYRKPVCLKKGNIPVAGIFKGGPKTLEIRCSMYEMNILDDLSCKHFKATTFEYPPVTTVDVLENGTLVWVSKQVELLSSVLNN